MENKDIQQWAEKSLPKYVNILKNFNGNQILYFFNEKTIFKELFPNLEDRIIVGEAISSLKNQGIYLLI